MKRVRITRTAYKDIAEIWHFIALDNIDAADRVRDAIEAATKNSPKCLKLATSVLM